MERSSLTATQSFAWYTLPPSKQLIIVALTSPLKSRFKSSRIVNVYADSDDPYGVPEILLQTRSKFLLGQVEAPNENDDEAYLTLTYPHGDLEETPSDDACLVILHWIMLGTLPADLTSTAMRDETVIDTLVHSWCMGEAWDMPDFQDGVMMCLLGIFDAKPKMHSSDVLIEAIKLAFANSSSESVLRRLLLEELVSAVYVDKITRVKHMDELDGCQGFAAQLALIKQRLHGAPERFGHRTDEDCVLWKEYMVRHDGAIMGADWRE